MRIEFTSGCSDCLLQPACKHTGENLQKIEDRATTIGQDVAEGWVFCPGAEDGRCQAEVQCPSLMSSSERSALNRRLRIVRLVKLPITIETVAQTDQQQAHDDEILSLVGRANAEVNGLRARIARHNEDMAQIQALREQTNPEN